METYEGKGEQGALSSLRPSVYANIPGALIWTDRSGTYW
jgi:hypothetical protein